MATLARHFIRNLMCDNLSRVVCGRLWGLVNVFRELKSDQVCHCLARIPLRALVRDRAPAEVRYRGGGGGGRGRTHLRGERGCVPERCRAPQNEDTPLHLASEMGHVKVVAKLLKAEANKEVKNLVRGGGGYGRGEGGVEGCGSFSFF